MLPSDFSENLQVVYLLFISKRKEAESNRIVKIRIFLTTPSLFCHILLYSILFKNNRGSVFRWTIPVNFLCKSAFSRFDLQAWLQDFVLRAINLKHKKYFTFWAHFNILGHNKSGCMENEKIKTRRPYLNFRNNVCWHISWLRLAGKMKLLLNI